MAEKSFRKPFLPIRLRKLIGTILILLVLFFYALIVMTIAVTTSVPDNPWLEFIFYLLAGMGWTIPAAAIIWWMQRPDQPPQG